MSSLTGNLAIVTGAGSGIGKAVCSILCARGAKVIGIDAKAEKIDEVNVSGVEKHVVDVTKKAEVNALYSDIKGKYNNAARILVNSAGITRDNLLVRLTEEEWEQVMDVNLKGTFLMTQAHALNLISQLKSSNNQLADLKSGLTGSIVNIASVSAKGNIGQANYSASKAGVIGFTKTTAMELARFGIRVNCVLPGFIDTPMTATVPDKVLEGVKKMIPLQRTGKPEEVAQLIGFLASDDSSYMTGTAIDIDGGLRM